MSLQFILGGSGSGKSHELYKMICDASVQAPGTQFLVLVPEQFTMQTQKELVHLHPKKGILNIDILSFQRLSHRVFEEVGADKRTVLEEMGKILLLRRCVGKCQGELTLLSGNLKKKGYLSEVKSLISELTQYDIDATKMEKMLEAAKSKPQLYYKLKDIQVLYEGFQKELEGKYITAEETLDALCQVVEKSKILKDCVLVLDGFTGFTPIQYKLLQKLLVLAREVYVTVTIDPREEITRIYGEHELFYLSKKTIRSLTELAEEAKCEILPPFICGKQGNPRFLQSRELSFLEKRIFRSGKNVKEKVFSGEERGEISIHSTANPAQECHYVGRKIRELVIQGHRYSDIAIIVGSMEAYEADLSYIMAQYEVPVFMDNTRTISNNPFIEWISAALAVLEQDYTRETVFRFLRTGLCGIKREGIDQLENYVLAAGIRGRKAWQEAFTKIPADWTREQVSTLEKIRVRIMREMVVFHKVMKEKTTVREKTESLYNLICSYQIQKQLDEYEIYFEKKENPDLKKEYSQVYRQVMALFDKMVELLGNEILTLQEYTELMQTGMEELKVGIIPPSSDLVQIGNLERTRLKDIKVLFFMGLNDGYVPAIQAGGGLLTETEREVLQSSKVELAPGARQESYIQKFYLYQNLTKPSHRLYLSYCRSDHEGKTMRPSYLIQTVLKIFPAIRVQDESKIQDITTLAAAPKAAMQYLLQGMQNLREKEMDPNWMELYNWYRRQKKYRQTIEELLGAVFFVMEDDAIGREAARQLYGDILENSVTRLEKFANCAFSHFLEYGLQLKERDEYSFKATDMGTIVHKVAELFVKKVTQENISWKELSETKRNELVDECVDEVTGEQIQEVLHSTRRNEYMITRIRRIMRRTAWALQKQLAAGSFYPASTEVSFSQIRNLDAVNISLSEKEKMHLQGRIDRIDLCQKDNQVLVKVIDYKSGNTSFDLVALYYGLQLQLVVYLNAAMELEKQQYPDKEIIPAGIFYYHVKDPIMETEQEETPEEINQKIIRELKLNGLVNEDPDIFREMDQEFESKSDIIPVEIKKDGSMGKNSRVASSDQFSKLSSYVHGKMREIGREIVSGTIAPVPSERNGKTAACDYCIYKEICRQDKKMPGTRSKRLKEITAEEIWKQMEIQDSEDEMDEGTK